MEKNKMKIYEVPIKEGQRLSEVAEIYPLPSNVVIHKTLPGLGATYGEINAPRHSIIVLPNRPVIEAKVVKHNKDNQSNERILGVYKGIHLDDILNYINDDSVTYKKILITPESCELKLKSALIDNWNRVKQEYYLLIDECERSIQDQDFREKISAPFDDFFDFANKGLISATTLPFSDPRFENLKHIILKPTYIYINPLLLLTTNNVVAALRDHLKENEQERYFIFLNSISATIALIEVLCIKNESKIHCSDNKETSVLMKGYKASRVADSGEFLKYNFFTSRFYSGLDIELPYKANVIIMTEVLFAEHSIVDPQTEVIQIVGRFRNGTNSITHISNFNPDIKVRSQEESLIYLQGQRDVYLQIIKLKTSLESEGAQKAINEILENTEFCRYFKSDGTYNYFMLDNYMQGQRVLSFYKAPEVLLTAYDNVKKHFEVSHMDKQYPISDKDRLRRQAAQGRKAEIKEVINQLKRLTPTAGNYLLGGERLLGELEAEYPDIVKAYRTIGEGGIAKCQYNESKINIEVAKAIEFKQFYQPEVLKAVHTMFQITGGKHRPHTNIYIKSTLQDIFDRHDIKVEAQPKHILVYFDGAQTTTTINKKKYSAYKLKAVKSEVHLPFAVK